MSMMLVHESPYDKTHYWVPLRCNNCGARQSSPPIPKGITLSQWLAKSNDRDGKLNRLPACDKCECYPLEVDRR